MVGGAKSHLESKPIHARDTQRAQTNPTETETDLCLSVSCGGMGQQWAAAGAESLGAVDLGMA